MSSRSAVPKTTLAFIPRHLRQRPAGSPMETTLRPQPQSSSSGYDSSTSSSDSTPINISSHTKPSSASVLSSSMARRNGSSTSLDDFSPADHEHYAIFADYLASCYGRPVTSIEAADVYATLPRQYC